MNPLDLSIAKLARSNGLKANKLRRYIEKFNGDIDKALKICKQGAKLKKNARKTAKGISPTLIISKKQISPIHEKNYRNMCHLVF